MPTPIRKRRSASPRRSQKLGLPPGSLVHLGERKTELPTITMMDYDASGLEEVRFRSLAEAQARQRHRTSLWLNVHGLHDTAVMGEIGKRFNLHPLVLEDILHTGQRAKVESYGDYLYIVLRFADYDAASRQVVQEQVSLVLGADFLLTFQERSSGAFDAIRGRLRSDGSPLRAQGADYLAYSLIDAIVDRYFAVLESLSDLAEDLEEKALVSASPAVLAEITHLKREATTLRRAVWPLRETVNQLARGDFALFRSATLPYLRDVYDHSVHVLESVEAIRDLVGDMMDIYLSSVSNRLNAEVRILTVITTVFVPATLIASIFGMNFHRMPLLDEPDGFYVALAMMAAAAVTMGALFWRRNWLSSR